MNKKQMKEFLKALDLIVAEKGIDRNVVIEDMEQALAAAYRKKGGPCRCTINPETGEMRLFSVRTVVLDEEFRDARGQITLTEAKEIVPEIELGETIENPVEMTDFGRVAAGTAKQVLVQRIKEAEKELIVNDLGDKQDELVIGTLSREDSKTYYVDLGRTFGLLPKDEVIPTEKLEMGSQIKCYVSKLEVGTKGVFILLSRTHYGFLKRLLELEIPELSDGTVILYSVARDAGVRSKISVYSENSNVEAVGSVIGANGNRINRILKQLSGEKIDVILYDKDPATFIANALSPAKNLEVFITDYKKKEAIVVAPHDMFTLAIGKRGQNVKLASRLTHYKLDVKDESLIDVQELRRKYKNDGILVYSDRIIEEEKSVEDEENADA